MDVNGALGGRDIRSDAASGGQAPLGFWVQQAPGWSRGSQRDEIPDSGFGMLFFIFIQR
jgi:hypothetical protein